MSRFASAVSSALLLAALLLSVSAQEASASASGGVNLSGPPVVLQSTTKTSAAQSATLKLFKEGASLYKAKLKGHSAKYQKKAYLKLTAHQQKAVRTFLSKYLQQTSTVKTGSNANTCVPGKGHCPLGVGSSSVSKLTTTKISTNAGGVGGCWQWSITLSEGGYVQPFPFPITWYTFQLYNYFCSDGQKITSWYVEPSNQYALPLFWDFSGYSDKAQDPTIGASTVIYFAQANYDMSPPVIKGITGVVLHRHPWIRIHVGADGSGVYEEGYT